MERTMYFLSAKYNVLLILQAAETVLLLRFACWLQGWAGVSYTN